jgi:hypothetical protein
VAVARTGSSDVSESSVHLHMRRVRGKLVPELSDIVNIIDNDFIEVLRSCSLHWVKPELGKPCLD